jgi:hypothetical protein
VAAASALIYSAVDTATRIQQGEVVSNLLRMQLDLASFGEPTPMVQTEIHEFAIVMTQNCELEQDHKIRNGISNKGKLLPNVLFCHVETAGQLRTSVPPGSDIWKRIVQNKDERYHFLQKVEADCDTLGQGLPELGIDFMRYFTIPTDEVYKRVAASEARRRCFLRSPYLEHLSNRFAHFISRVALPEDHFSEPEVKRP